MGINTVAVLLNDVAHEMPDRMRQAVVDYRYEKNEHFGLGTVISAAHADHYQVVVVHGNTGWTLDKAPQLPVICQDQLAECLRRHGWRVTKNVRPASKRVSGL